MLGMGVVQGSGSAGVGGVGLVVFPPKANYKKAIFLFLLKNS